MVAYHYWKCYYKDGVTFQTAKLFSIEVDYYNFGTCELTDGAYFCGDHSCQTFKHVGNLDGKHGLPTVNYENIEGRAYQGRLYGHNDRHWQPGPRGEGSRIDQLGPMYYEHVSLKLSFATLQAGSPAVTRAILGPNGIQSGDRSALYPIPGEGDCKKFCDAEPLCKIYMENKATGPRSPIDQIRCHLIWSDVWAREMPAFNTALVADAGWQTYSKFSHQKEETWLHAPIHHTVSTAPGARLSTTRGDVLPGIPYGRRLEGVY